MRHWAAPGFLAVAIALAGCGGSRPSSSRMSARGGTGASVPGTTAGSGAPARSARTGQDWPTYQLDNARTGAVASGPPLGRVRRLWTSPVTGAVYAQPLVVSGRVIVATEDDRVYAIDARNGRRLWEARLGMPVPGSSLPCGNIDPSGITGTPVADPRAQTVYVVAFLSGFRHLLIALNLRTGAVRREWPVDPPGADFTTEQQRAALALSRGRVYVSYGGLYGDCGSYHGWVIGVPAAGRGAGGEVSYRVPSANEGGIWAPPGPSIDRAGSLYVATGNGSSSSFDYGNAVIKLTPDLRQKSFFAPTDAGRLNTTDSDLGSTGPILLPRSRAFIVGKSGVGYLLSTSNLGGIGGALSSIGISAAFGADAYASGSLYVPTTAGLVALRLSGDGLARSWTQSAATLPPIVAGPGVWVLSGGGTLFQLDPRDGRIAYSAPVGEVTHFTAPAASGGRVYVAAGGRVQAFG